MQKKSTLQETGRLDQFVGLPATEDHATPSRELWKLNGTTSSHKASHERKTEYY